MQTFLPYVSYTRSAQALDFKRLGKQRVEAMQIYKILTRQPFSGIPIKFKTKAWVNHPAVLMWRGFEDSLAEYYNCIRTEWIKRGYKNTMPELPVNNPTSPYWLDDLFCSSHRSNLLRKNPEFYSKYGWTETPDSSYIWPKRK